MPLSNVEIVTFGPGWETLSIESIPRIHELKTWPIHFEPLLKGDRKCELRKNDRGFSVGDELRLKEFVPCPMCKGSRRVWSAGDMDACVCEEPHGTYTGRELRMGVTHIFNDKDICGLIDGYVLMSLEDRWEFSRGDTDRWAFLEGNVGTVTKEQGNKKEGDTV